MDDVNIGNNDLVLVSTQKLIFIRDVITKIGFSSKEVFKDFCFSDNYQNQLNNTASIATVKSVYENILGLNIQAAGLEIGQHISTKHYGLYGCTMLCRETFEDTLLYCIKYHDLTTRTTEIYIDTSPDGNPMFCCKDLLEQPNLLLFNLELHICIHLALFREFLGDPTFTPVRVYLEYTKPEYFSLYQDFFGCPVLFEQSFTGIEFTKEQFTLELPKHNPLAIPVLMKSCDVELQAYLKDNVLLQRVYHWVSENVHNQLLAEDLASFLCLTPRTLRRKLTSYETSFSKICTEIKCKFSKRYCIETTLSFDDIAISVGFNETANFRRAFKTWTGLTPSEYKKKHQINK